MIPDGEDVDHGHNPMSSFRRLEGMLVWLCIVAAAVGLGYLQFLFRGWKFGLPSYAFIAWFIVWPPVAVFALFAGLYIWIRHTDDDSNDDTSGSEAEQP